MLRRHLSGCSCRARNLDLSPRRWALFQQRLPLNQVSPDASSVGDPGGLRLKRVHQLSPMAATVRHPCLPVIPVIPSFRGDQSVILAGLIELLGDKLLSKDGVGNTASSLAGKKLVMLYFSAHWCPPCKTYTPELAQAYLASQKKDEVIAT